MGPVLGSCLGPIAGGYITDYSTWPWVFHATSIFAGVIILTSLCLSRETYAPVLLLRRKKQALQLTPAYKGLTLLTQFEQATNTTTPSTSKSPNPNNLLSPHPLPLPPPPPHPTHCPSPLPILRLHLRPRLPHPLDLPHPMENPIPPARQHRLPALPRPVHRLPPRRTNLRPSLRQDLPASQNLQPRHRQARVPPPTHDPRESARPHRLLYLRLVRTVQNPLDRSRYRYCSAAYGRYGHFPVYERVAPQSVQCVRGECERWSLYPPRIDRVWVPVV